MDTLHNLSAEDIFGTSDDEVDDDSEELTGQLGRDEYSDVEDELGSTESLDAAETVSCCNDSVDSDSGDSLKAPDWNPISSVMEEGEVPSCMHV